MFSYFSRVVEPQEREIASAMTGGFLGLGITIGSAMSLVLVRAI